MWLHVLSDLGVWSAYVAIPGVLAFFVWRKKDIPFRNIFWLFSAFILACGTTHLIEAVMFWWPAYRLAGLVKMMTALISWGTVLALIPITPKALAMRAPEELELEIDKRRRAEAELREANLHLEQRVQERTSDLAQMNARLEEEIAERKKREQEIITQHEQLRITLQSIGDAVIVTDAQGNVRTLNPVAQHLTGWNEDAIGKPLTEVFVIMNECTREPLENPVTQVLLKGVTVGLANHTILISRDGRECAIDDSAAPIRGSGGDLHGVVLVFRDVSERRRMEVLQRDYQQQLEIQVKERTRELQTSEERFRLLVEGTRDYAIFMLNPEGVVVSWNPGAERIKGYRAEEIIGQHFSRFYPPEDVAAGKPVRELEIATRVGRYEEEGWRLRKDGTKFWASVVLTALRDPQGVLQGFVKITRDSTERKNAEENARRLLQEQAARMAAESAEQRIRGSEQSARFLAEASKVLAGLVDYQSTLQKVAGLAVPFFADWCTVDLLEPSGSLRRLVVTHADPAKVELANELHKRFPANPNNDRGAYHIARTGQSLLVAEVTDAMISEMVPDPELLRIIRELSLSSYIGVPLSVRGKTIGVITFIRAESGQHYSATDLAVAEDLAHRTAIAMENAQLYSEAQQADRRKDEFLATLAHELRNPLAPLRNGLEIMKGPSASPQSLQAIRDMMERQVLHMTRMVDDLLDVSRITRGKIELRKEIVDVATVLTRAVEAVSPMLKENRHKFSVTLPSTPLRVNVDPTRFEQIVTNLLQNAIKYTDAGGHVCLTARRKDDQLEMTIKDNGIGIASDLLSHVFEPFVQSRQQSNRSQSGLGIGLALVRNLVEMHQGSVHAASAGVGQGSEFTVLLPLAPPEEAKSGDADSGLKPSKNHSSRRHILVVDDNVDAADSMAMLLELQGHEVRVAHDGHAALAAVKTAAPEIIFLDIGMPGMNGYEVARTLRQHSELGKLVLIAMTGWGQDVDRRRSQEAGFDHHLVKPADPQMLQGLLQKGDAG